jgi:hypothetical protein
MAPALFPLSQADGTKPNAQLVAEACGRAAAFQGLSRDELGAVVGNHRTSIERTGLDPKTKEGELGLLFLHVYRSLHALFGGDLPSRQLLERIEGLTRVATYLDALRG